MTKPTRTAAVLTVSDRCTRGETPDQSGPLIEATLSRCGYVVAARRLVADERDEIAAVLNGLARDTGTALVITTGGTGLGPRDVTPEATLEVIEREVPGIAEALRSRTAELTPSAWLSRGLSGLCGDTLIVNLPGSRKAVEECLRVLLPLLPHALDTAAGADH